MEQWQQWVPLREIFREMLRTSLSGEPLDTSEITLRAQGFKASLQPDPVYLRTIRAETESFGPNQSFTELTKLSEDLRTVPGLAMEYKDEYIMKI